MSNDSLSSFRHDACYSIWLSPVGRLNRTGFTPELSMCAECGFLYTFKLHPNYFLVQVAFFSLQKHFVSCRALSSSAEYFFRPFSSSFRFTSNHREALKQFNYSKIRMGRFVEMKLLFMINLLVVLLNSYSFYLLLLFSCGFCNSFLLTFFFIHIFLRVKLMGFVHMIAIVDCYLHENGIILGE